MFSEILEVLGRGARLKCPCCGFGRLFKSAFRMHERCSACGERFEREPGQSLGTIYINLALTIVLTVIGFLLTDSFTSLTVLQQQTLWMAVAAAGPFLFYRLAKGLWTSIIFFGEGLYLAWPSR